MNRLTRTLIVLSVFSLVTVCPAMDQARPNGKTRTFAISGNASIAGVTMKGLPGDPVTNNNGYYMAAVNHGWSGTVTPTKEGYSFEPPYLRYTKVASDLNDDYQAKIIKYTISGQVGMTGVEMQGLPGNIFTDENGYYTCMVDYGWAGTVTPTKDGYTFMPPRKHYTKFTMNLTNQNYTANSLDAQLEEMYGMYGSSRGQPGRLVEYRKAVAPVGSRKVLVIPDKQVTPEDLAAITEDMKIMSHILDERFKETRRIQGVFTDFGDFFGRDNRQTEATYLQGYGVLFSMEVNFSFSPPPKQQQQQVEQTDENVDSTWQRAKQQVFSPGEIRGSGGSDSAKEYNSQMVEELKRDLITTLKHAANIRGAQPDEWIILTVVGGGRQNVRGFGGRGYMMGGMGMYGGATSGGAGGIGGGYGVSGSYGSGMAGGSFGGGMGGFGGMGGSGLGRGMDGFSGTAVFPATVLTIRAKKSDIDAYAKDEQIAEQFRRKVQIIIY